jgi:hypothetical protein
MKREAVSSGGPARVCVTNKCAIKIADHAVILYNVNHPFYQLRLLADLFCYNREAHRDASVHAII